MLFVVSHSIETNFFSIFYCLLVNFIQYLIKATLSDKIIGEENIADYLLYWMNKHHNYSYCDFFGLDTPSDNIIEVLVKGAIYLNQLRDVKLPDTSNRFS